MAHFTPRLILPVKKKREFLALKFLNRVSIWGHWPLEEKIKSGIKICTTQKKQNKTKKEKPQTRPDTRLPVVCGWLGAVINKAGYTAIPVTCRGCIWGHFLIWAEAVRPKTTKTVHHDSSCFIDGWSRSIRWINSYEKKNNSFISNIIVWQSGHKRNSFGCPSKVVVQALGSFLSRNLNSTPRYVGWSVSPSVDLSITFLNWSSFWTIAPAQLSATGLPCILPCFDFNCRETKLARW